MPTLCVKADDEDAVDPGEEGRDDIVDDINAPDGNTLDEALLDAECLAPRQHMTEPPRGLPPVGSLVGRGGSCGDGRVRLALFRTRISPAARQRDNC